MKKVAPEHKLTVDDLNGLLQALSSVTKDWPQEKKGAVGMMLLVIDDDNDLWTSNTRGVDPQRLLSLALMKEVTEKPSQSFDVKAGQEPVMRQGETVEEKSAVDLLIDLLNDLGADTIKVVPLVDAVVGDEEIPITVAPVLDTKVN